MNPIKGPGIAKKSDGSTLRIAIVHSRWNTLIVDALVDGAKEALFASGVKPDNLIVDTVPGSYELPLAIKQLNDANSDQIDAIIAIGVVLKGETTHAEHIVHACSYGLMKFQMESRIPVVFGVLTDLTEEQALARAGLKGGTGKEATGHNHGLDWGLAAIELGERRRSFSLRESHRLPLC